MKHYGITKKVLAGVLGTAILGTSIPFSTAVADDTTTTGEIIYSSDFEDASESLPFTGRGGVETISVSTAQAHGGNSSMCVSDRTKSWHGPQILLDNLCEANTEYTVSAWVKAEWYNSIKVSLEYTDSAGERHYDNLSSATSNGDWAEFSEVKFSFTDSVTNVYIYFECNDGATLYIDDFTLAKAPTIPIEDDLVSLSDAYSDYFKIGTAVMASNLASPSFMDLVEKHFDGSMTFGNELKPDYVLDQSASQAYAAANNGDDTNPQVSFAQADSLLKYCAANNIPVRGHTLVWHSQTPDWFFKEGFSDDGDWVDKATMIERMRNYIKNVMEGLATQYPDVEFYAWDVVNEAWTDSGTPREAGSSKSEDSNSSAWVRIFGDNSFIEYAFQFAKEFAPDGCKLYYNDYNEYMPAKTEAIYNMAMELKEKGLIDGIGMQSHLDVSFPTVATYKKALDKFASTGLDVQITELDITTSDTSEAGLETQAQMYSDLFDLYVEYADSISAVVLWGVTDDQSWRASRLPLLFDATYQAKPAYYSIIDNIDTSTITTSATTATTTTTTTTTTATTPQVTDIPFSTVPGDLDGDEVVALTDLVLLQKYLLQRQSLTAEQGEVADYNGDGNINVIDLILLKRYIIVNR